MNESIETLGLCALREHSKLRGSWTQLPLSIGVTAVNSLLLALAAGANSLQLLTYFMDSETLA